MNHIPPSRRNTVARANEPGVSEARVADLVTAGVLASAKQIYDQLGEETAKHLEVMEDRVTERVLREIAERRLTTRFMRWWKHTVLRRPVVSITSTSFAVTTSSAQASEPNGE